MNQKEHRLFEGVGNTVTTISLKMDHICPGNLSGKVMMEPSNVMFHRAAFSRSNTMLDCPFFLWLQNTRSLWFSSERTVWFCFPAVCSGRWKVFTGNELAALFGWWMFFCWRENSSKDADVKNVYMLATTVSSKILKAIALKEGFHFEVSDFWVACGLLLYTDL